MAYSFNGTTEGMAFNGIGSTDTVRFAVAHGFRLTESPTGNHMLTSLSRTSNTATVQIGIDSSGILQMFNVIVTGSVSPTSAGSATLSVGVDYTLLCVFDRSGGTVRYWLCNGTTVVDAASGTISTTTFSPQIIGVGYSCNNNQNDSYFPGVVYKWALVSLTADQLTALNTSASALAVHQGRPLVDFAPDQSSYVWDADLDAGGYETLHGAGVDLRRTAVSTTSTGANPQAYATYTDSLKLPAAMRAWGNLSAPSWDTAKVIAFNGTAGGTLTASGGIGYNPYPKAIASVPTRRHVIANAGSGAGGSSFVIANGSLYDGSWVRAWINSAGTDCIYFDAIEAGTRHTGKRWTLRIDSDSERYETATVNSISVPSGTTFVPSGQYLDVQAGLVVEHAHVRTAGNVNRILVSIANLDPENPGRIRLTPVFLSEGFSDADADVAAAQQFSLTLNSGSKDSIVGRNRLYAAFVDYRNTPKNGGVMWLAQFDYAAGAWSHTATEELYRADPATQTDEPGHIHTGYPRIINGQLRYYFVWGDTFNAQHGYLTRSNADLGTAGTWSTEPVWLGGYRRGSIDNHIGFLPGADVDEAFTLGDIDAAAWRLRLDDGPTQFHQQVGGMVMMAVLNKAPFESFALNANLADDGVDIPKFGFPNGTAAAFGYGLNGRIGGCADGRHLFMLTTPPIEGQNQFRGRGVMLATDDSVFDWDINGASQRIVRANWPRSFVARPVLCGGGNTNLLDPQTPTLPTGDPIDGYSAVSGDTASALALIGRSTLPTPATVNNINAQVFSDTGTVRATNDGEPTGVSQIVATSVPIDEGSVYTKMWVFRGEPAFDSTQPTYQMRATTDGGSSYAAVSGDQARIALANNMWVPHLHVQGSLPASPFNLGFRFNSQSDADLSNYNGEFEGSYIAWFVESVRTGAAMCGDPLTITGFTLDNAVSDPNPFAIGIMAMIPEMEWDTTIPDQAVTIAELVNGDSLDTTGSGVRISLETPTAGSPTITATYMSAGSPVGGSGTDSATLPAGYYPLDSINIVALRNGDGSVLNLLVSIGGCVPVALEVSNSGLITLPPEKIVLHNQQVYGVSVLEDASGWSGLAEDSFASLADTIIATLALTGGFGGWGIHTAIRIGL